MILRYDKDLHCYVEIFVFNVIPTVALVRHLVMNFSLLLFLEPIEEGSEGSGNMEVDIGE